MIEGPGLKGWSLLARWSAKREEERQFHLVACQLFIVATAAAAAVAILFA